MNNFMYEIISGIPPEYIEEYFKDICDRKDNNKYYGKGWKVKIDHQKPRTYSVITIPSTRIIFTGDKVECERLIDSYRMKFLTGGG